MRDLKALVEELANGKRWAQPGPYDKGSSRTIESSVVLGKAKGESGEVELTLSVSHRKERKLYSARLHIATTRQDGVFKVSSYSLFDEETNALLDQVDSPRYSAKALEAFWELQIGKLRDNPELLTALNLDHNQEPPAEPEEDEDDGTFKAKELVDLLKAEGLDATYIEQTGGGTATLYVQSEALKGHDMFLVGPGSHNRYDPDNSDFYMGELCYGLDHWNDDGESMRDEEPESHYVNPKSSVADAAKEIAAAYKKHHNL